MANIQTRLAIALAVTWIAGSAGIPPCRAQTGDVAVAVNQNNPVDHLSIQEVRQIFVGEKRSWAGGSPIKVFVRAPGARERVVLLKLLGMSESEYKRHWTVAVFRGEVPSEPVALFSNGMQKEAIAIYPGAVALVNVQDVKAGMKVVRVDGHMPGEAGYPFN
jgi:ABC-type phosphate transport system substrate-binding protein